MVGRQAAIEDKDGFVLPKRHPVRVEEPGRFVLAPDQVIAEHLGVRGDELGNERLRGRKHDRRIGLRHATVLVP